MSKSCSVINDQEDLRRRHLAGSLGVVTEPMRASFKSAGLAVVSVPELLRVTCDPYSPTMVSLTVVRTENPEISMGPCTVGPLRLHVRLGIPSTSIGASTVRPPRYGVTPFVEVEKVQPAGCFSEPGTMPVKLKIVKKSGFGSFPWPSTWMVSSILILK